MLRELQTAMRQSLLSAEDAAASAFLAKDRIPAHQLLDVYRNNTFASLVSVLEAAYPVLCNLVGAENFRHAAYRYAEASPPRVPQLSQYGDEFAAFLEDFEPARGLPYLPDLARLEWHRNEAYFAADALVVDARALDKVPAEEYARLRLMLHPSARLLVTTYPVLRLVEMRAEEREPVPAAHGADGRFSLTLRPDAHVQSVAISCGDHALLKALQAGAILESAAADALAAEPAIDLQQALLQHINRGTFSAFVLDNIKGSGE